MSPERYRQYAADCVTLSAAVDDPAVRSWLERMAIVWSDLADQAESKAVAQQQQQPQKNTTE